MKTSELIARAGRVQLIAEALGIKHQAVYAWGDEVPELRVYQLKERRPEWFKGKPPVIKAKRSAK